MIVKDEEENIERALSWGKNVMWEQIVVDTGSTDRTVELARKQGAKVHFLEWQDDFAAAKNHAIDKAKGEWIAFLDADEYMTSEDVEKLSTAIWQLGCGHYDGLFVGLHNLDDEGKISSSCSHLRFFRNDPDIRYRRRIHEQLVSLSGRTLRLMDGTHELSIFHTGYQRKAAEGKKKSGRNKRLLWEELKEHPEDYEMLSYMGDECFGEGDGREAEGWYRRAVSNMPVGKKGYDQRNAVTFVRLLTILTERKDAAWEEAEAVYEQAVEALPEEADFDYVAGRFFAAHAQPDQAIRHLEMALYKLDAHGCNKAFFLAADLEAAYVLLAKCSYETGDLQKCVTYAVGYLKYDRYGMALLSWLLRALLQHEDALTTTGEWEQVIEFLSKLYDLSSLKDRLFLVKAAERSDRYGFSHYVRDRFFTLEEQIALGLQKQDGGRSG